MSRPLDDLASGLRALQTLQRLYDAEMWDIEDPAFDKLRHIHIHLSITVGKIAKIIEPDDHSFHRHEAVDVASRADELRPMLADLLMHAGQIANLLGADLNQILRQRYRQNALRFSPASAFATLERSVTGGQQADSARSTRAAVSEPHHHAE